MVPIAIESSIGYLCVYPILFKVVIGTSSSLLLTNILMSYDYSTKYIPS